MEHPFLRQGHHRRRGPDASVLPPPAAGERRVEPDYPALFHPHEGIGCIPGREQGQDGRKAVGSHLPAQGHTFTAGEETLCRQPGTRGGGSQQGLSPGEG